MSERKRYRLRELDVTRVDLVDRGANQHAEILIAKADDSKDPKKSKVADRMKTDLMAVRFDEEFSKDKNKRKRGKARPILETEGLVAKHATHDQQDHDPTKGRGGRDRNDRVTVQQLADALSSTERMSGAAPSWKRSKRIAEKYAEQNNMTIWEAVEDARSHMGKKEPRGRNLKGKGRNEMEVRNLATGDGGFSRPTDSSGGRNRMAANHSGDRNSPETVRRFLEMVKESNRIAEEEKKKVKKADAPPSAPKTAAPDASNARADELKTWMAQVDQILMAQTGVGIRELSSIPWIDLFEAKMKPADAVKESLAGASQDPPEPVFTPEMDAEALGGIPGEVPEAPVSPGAPDMEDGGEPEEEEEPEAESPFAKPSDEPVARRPEGKLAPKEKPMAAPDRRTETRGKLREKFGTGR